MKKQIAHAGAKLALTLLMTSITLPAAAQTERKPVVNAGAQACLDLNHLYQDNHESDPSAKALAQLCAKDRKGRETSIRFITGMGKLLPWALAQFEVAGR